MMLSRVDLPEPEGPIMDMNSPSPTWRLISFNRKMRWPPVVTHLNILFSCSSIYRLFGLFHSLLKISAGLVLAALRLCQLTVDRATKRVSAPAKAKIHHPMVVL